MPAVLQIAKYIEGFSATPLARWADLAPWEFTARSERLVRELLADLPTDGYSVAGEVAVHRRAIVESGAVLKGPLSTSPGCFVAAGASLRGGNWVGQNSTFGPAAELKSSSVFPHPSLPTSTSLATPGLAPA